jgi:hypothetical protein
MEETVKIAEELLYEKIARFKIGDSCSMVIVLDKTKIYSEEEAAIKCNDIKSSICIEECEVLVVHRIEQIPDPLSVFDIVVTKIIDSYEKANWSIT